MSVTPTIGMTSYHFGDNAQNPKMFAIECPNLPLLTEAPLPTWIRHI